MSRREELRVLLDALGPTGRRRLGLLAALTLLGGAAEYGTLLALLALLRDWLAPGGGSVDLGLLLAFAAAVLAAGGLRFALLVASQRLAYDTGHRLMVAVQRRLLERGWIAHVEARSSAPLAAIEQVEMVVHGLLLPLLQGLTATVLGIAILAALVRIDLVAAVSAGLLLGGLFLLAVGLSRPAIRRAGHGISSGYEERIAAVQEQVGAMRELLLGGMRHAAAERFRRIDRSLAEAKAALVVASGTPRLLVETLGLLALVGLAAWLAGRTGELETVLPTLAALALGAQRLLPLAQTLANAVLGFSANAAPLTQLSAILAAPDLEEEAPPDPLPFRREIRLEGVSFTYPGREAPALRGIDLVLRRGERVALAGRNGSGKTTLTDVVMGLLRPSEGRVLIDGEPLGQDSIAAWQRNIAHVPQAPFFADASIAANIAFMQPDPDWERVREAARLAGLDELIGSLAQGFDTRIGSGGLKLSGGQRQRLALARALYALRPLLVLDEATSALDPQSEAHVLAALDALQAAGTTILLIAHRAKLLEGCERVVRLSHGGIVED